MGSLTKPAKRRLSKRQIAWVEAYLGEAKFNATEAARLVGYKNPRISGSENLNNPRLKAMLQHRLTEAAMGPEEVRGHIARLALHAESEAVQLRALELIAKMHGAFDTTLKVTATVESHGAVKHEHTFGEGTLAEIGTILAQCGALEPEAPPGADPEAE